MFDISQLVGPKTWCAFTDQFHELTEAKPKRNCLRTPGMLVSKNIVYLHPQPEPIALYLRLGAFHRQVKKLLAAGSLPSERVVVDALAFEQQKNVVSQLADAGCEIVLDTNVAELSVVGRCGGAVKSAPWARAGVPLQPSDFRFQDNDGVVGKIARFASERNIDVALAPTHLLDNSNDPWFSLDRQACADLRHRLDAECGSAVAIDYPLIVKYSSLRDPAQRRAIIAGLRDVPFDNLLLHVPGFGSSAKAPMLRRFIAAAIDFQQLERPVVIDGVGGLAGLATTAFGAAGGISHGLGEKERFNAGDWHKRPVPRGGGGGREKRVLIPRLDRLLSVKQVDTLMAAEGGRRLLGCSDRACCPNGHNDTIKNLKGHYLRQRVNPLQRLSRVPELRRVHDFFKYNLDPATRTAETAAKLTVDAATAKMLEAANERLGRFGPVLRDLHQTAGNGPHAHAPVRRKRSDASTAVGARR